MSGFKESFYQNFIEKDRWQYLLTGLENTLLITIFAVLIGVAIGFLVAIIRASHDKNGSLKILNFICRVYLTVIRGTPTMIQLMITYYIIFASVNVSKIFVAVCAFGINSGAYVAEIVRSGIMSIDQGQFEAGRSLGLNYTQTMTKIILPQAVKNILPTLGNEFIALVKDTSVVSFIAAVDLYKVFNEIGVRNYEFIMPYAFMALIYIVLVLVISLIFKLIEKYMRRTERR